MFTKFPSIESFAHVVRGQRRFNNPAKVRFGAKIKLHGTNAGIRITSGGAKPATVTAQSRSRDITPEMDNCGFAQWVAENEDAWFTATAEGAPDIVFFGEWAGKGIQKGDAVCGLNQKYFFVFSAQVEDQMITSPEHLEMIIPDLDDVLVLPWDMVWSEPVDLGDDRSCEIFSRDLDKYVTEIGEQDPFIHGVFGVEGPGEGWVVCPITDLDGADIDESMPRDLYSSLTFKVKTEAHSAKKGKKAPVQIEVPESVKAFVEMFVTPARCAQGVTEACEGVAETRRTGDFLKWLGQDVKKESVAELEDAGLQWKDVTKHVTKAAQVWWLAKCKEI